MSIEHRAAASVAGLDPHAAVGLQGGEGIDEGGVAQAADVADLAAGERGCGVGEGVQDALSSSGSTGVSGLLSLPRDLAPFERVIKFHAT
jgi:hypothetical protein